MYDTLHTDILIIGSGLSGLMAAYTLKLPPEKDLMILSTGSGASPNVIGFNLPLHEADTVDCFAKDTLRSGHYQNDRKLVKALCGDSLELIDLLNEIGFQLDMDGDNYALRRPLGSTFPRVAGEGNITGHSIQMKIKSKLLERENVTTLKSIRALSIKTEDGAVRGVIAYNLSENKFVCIEKKAVILACGGFCNIYPFSTNTCDIGGDGIAMAYNADVPLIDLEFVQFEPTAAVCPAPIRGLGVSTTLCHEGAVLRNTDGERFMLKYGPEGEQVNKDVMCKLIFQEIQNGKCTSTGGVYFDATGVGAQRLNEAYDLFVKRYGKFGIDITKDQMEVAPAAHTSLGGVKIAPDCSTSVRGLFACGEIAGGIHGANRIGGNAGLETMVFGRRVGESASRYMGRTVKQALPCSDIQWENWIDETVKKKALVKGLFLNREQMESMRKSMQTLLSEDLNVIREGDGIKSAAKELTRLLFLLESSDVGTDSYDMFLKLRLHNDLTAAYLLALAALERTESAGCHIRSDSKTGDCTRYRIKIERGAEGPVVKRERLSSLWEVLCK